MPHRVAVGIGYPQRGTRRLLRYVDREAPRIEGIRVRRSARAPPSIAGFPSRPEIEGGRNADSKVVVIIPTERSRRATSRRWASLLAGAQLRSRRTRRHGHRQQSFRRDTGRVGMQSADASAWTTSPWNGQSGCGSVQTTAGNDARTTIQFYWPTREGGEAGRLRRRRCRRSRPLVRARNYTTPVHRGADNPALAIR